MRAYVRTGRSCTGHFRNVRKIFLHRPDTGGGAALEVPIMPASIRILVNILSSFGKGFALTGKDEGSPIKNR
jgi:hypothetical protein